MWEEEQVRENYRSAVGHLDKVKIQVEEDIKRGFVIKLPLEEARRRYGSHLN